MSHILIVEDEPIIRMALRKLLERNKYIVNEAGSVKEATSKHNRPIQRLGIARSPQPC